MSIIDQRKYHCIFFLFNSNLYVHHRLMKVPFPPIFSFLCPTCINKNNIVSFLSNFHFYVQHRSTEIVQSLFPPISFLCPTQIIFVFMSNIEMQSQYCLICLDIHFMSRIDQQELNCPFFQRYIYFYVKHRSIQIFSFLCPTKINKN